LQPKVSVIIPNYNHAPYLIERIESVLNQTYQEFEVIILDDCSTDNSREIIEQYRNHPKVSQIVYNETNSGSTFKQWQRGIELAKGEWIWIAESDDWCEPTLLGNLIKPVISNENVVLSYCGSIAYFNDSILYISNVKYFNKIHNGLSFIKERMIKSNNIVNASMVIFSKHAANTIANNFSNLKFCGDWYFWICIAEKGLVYECGKVLNYFRKHDKDVTGISLIEGRYYTEYLEIILYLKNKEYITTSGYYHLLYVWLIRLNKDSNVDYKYKKEIFKIYLDKIGKKRYYDFIIRFYFKKIKNKFN
jgi:glycosyltransferase involved in cell wall biosynthesis